MRTAKSNPTSEAAAQQAAQSQWPEGDLRRNIDTLDYEGCYAQWRLVGTNNIYLHGAAGKYLIERMATLRAELTDDQAQQVEMRVNARAGTDHESNAPRTLH